MSSLENRKILLPKVRPGAVIGIVAPSGPVEPEKFNSGIQILKKMGFEIVVPKDLFKPEAYLAGPDDHRAEQLNKMFLNPEIEVIMCARGGFGAMKILPLIDFDLIKKNSKIFIGFSDATALLTNIYSLCGQVVFHGPVVTTLPDATDNAIDSLRRVIVRESDTVDVVFDNLDTIYPGKITAPVTGGNLTTLCHLVGTAFEPTYGGHILFIEDVGEAVYRIDRMLSHMKLAGCFDGLSGLVLGAFEDCGEVSLVYDLVRNFFKGYGFPILSGLEIGHVNNNITIPIGLEATLDSDRGRLSYLCSK